MRKIRHLIAVITAGLVTGLVVASTRAQDGTTKLLENARVVVWSVGGNGKSTNTPREGLLISLVDGTVRIVEPRRSVAASEPAILIELKDYRAKPLELPRASVRAFPRTGARLIVDHDRFTAWDVSWTMGMRTAMHFHDKDVVAVYLDAGTVRSLPLAGEPTATPRSRGEVAFLPRGRTHVEECIAGPRRDIIVELKDVS